MIEEIYNKMNITVKKWDSIQQILLINDSKLLNEIDDLIKEKTHGIN